MLRRCANTVSMRCLAFLGSTVKSAALQPFRSRHCGSDCRVDPGVADMPLADFLKVQSADEEG